MMVLQLFLIAAACGDPLNLYRRKVPLDQRPKCEKQYHCVQIFLLHLNVHSNLQEHVFSKGIRSYFCTIILKSGKNALRKITSLTIFLALLEFLWHLDCGFLYSGLRSR